MELMTSEQIKQMVNDLLLCIPHDNLYHRKCIDVDPAGSTYEYTVKKCVEDAYKFLGLDIEVLK